MDLTQLIITGDDFGLSSQVNEAVHRDFEAGLLQQASLMVTGGAVGEAVRIAKRYPDLGVGLHLTLCLGKATERSALTNAEREFANSPLAAGLAYLLRQSLWPSLRQEITSQFAHFRALGLGTDYWDGHCHLHLHPKVLDYTLNEAADFCFLRLVQEPRPPHFLGVIFNALSQAARPKLASRGKRVAEVVLGLGESVRMGTEAFLKCLEKISLGGLSEIYYHPGGETNPLNVERVSAAIRQRNITLGPVRNLT